jgi:hypothetical protein
VVFSAGLIVSATLMAAEVWDSKPFHAWTAKELEKVLTSSPWAGKGSITYVRNTATQPPILEETLVTWASARVMREALTREEFGATPDIPKEAQGVIAQKPPFYMITVKISKSVNSARHASQAATMQNETFLQVRGKPPIPAQQAEGQVLEVGVKPGQTAPAPAASPEGTGRGPALFAASPAQRAGGGGGTAGGGGTSGGGQRGGTPTPAPLPGSGGRGGRGPRAGGSNEPPTTASLVIFRFPRDEITLEDKEVEFVTRLCGGFGGFRGTVPIGQPSGGRGPVFELSAGAQRDSGSGAPARGAAPPTGAPVRMGEPLPTCNYLVKKKFKLKDMVVKGELQL